jgi:hypothetical protein
MHCRSGILFPSRVPAPNPLLKQTRSPRYRSDRSLRSLCSLLARHPFGTRRLGVATALALGLATGCRDKAPTEPSVQSLSGTWEGALVRSPCLGDWTHVELRLEQSGDLVTGTVDTKDGQHFPIVGNVTRGSGHLSVILPTNSGLCPSMGLEIMDVGRDSFSSQALGRCCGTILETVEFAQVLNSRRHR